MGYPCVLHDGSRNCRRVSGRYFWIGRLGSIPSGTRSKRVSSWHGNAQSCGDIPFYMQLAAATQQPYHPTDVSSLTTILAILALIVSFFSAWLNAELVYRLSIGVYPAAHENAENSVRE